MVEVRRGQPFPESPRQEPGDARRFGFNAEAWGPYSPHSHASGAWSLPLCA